MISVPHLVWTLSLLFFCTFLILIFLFSSSFGSVAAIFPPCHPSFTVPCFSFFLSCFLLVFFTLPCFLNVSYLSSFLLFLFPRSPFLPPLLPPRLLHFPLVSSVFLTSFLVSFRPPSFHSRFLFPPCLLPFFPFFCVLPFFTSSLLHPFFIPFLLPCLPSSVSFLSSFLVSSIFPPFLPS